MKKQIILLLASALLLSGCVSSTRLDSRAMVQAIGLDRQGEIYHLTLQIHDIQSGGVKIAYASGESLTKMLSELAVREGKQMFYGDLRLAMVGEGAARAGIGDFLEFLNGMTQIPPTLPIVVAQGSAGELLATGKNVQGAQAENLEAMLENAKKTGQAVSSTIMEILGAIENGNASAVVPLVSLAGGQASERPAQEGASDPLLDKILGEITEEGSQEEQTAQEKSEQDIIEMAGVGVFRDDRLERQLDVNTARGLGWLGHEFEVATVVVKDARIGNISTVTRVTGMKITPELQGDNMVFRFQVKVRSGVTETGMYDQDSDADDIAYLEELQEFIIRTEIERAVTAAGREGLDPIGLVRLVKQRQPDFYRAHADDWAQVMRVAGYSVDVSCTVTAGGTAARNLMQTS